MGAPGSNPRGYPTAVSGFFKHFEKPIEEIIGGNGAVNFANADAADLFGVELEARKTLDVLAESLADFTAIANVTLVKSVVELGDRRGTGTNASRPLSYQSPYVVNLALDYGNDKTQTDIRALYNVYGPRITVVGANRLPHIYELPRNQLDVSVAQKLSKRFELKLQGQNLLAAPVVFAYRNQPAYRLVPLENGSLLFQSLGRNAATRRYNPGTTLTLSATYTY